MGVYADCGSQQLVITTLNYTFLQFKYLGHGIITWMTRGVHFGYNRNNLTFHVDDAFAPLPRGIPALNCTPGEDCLFGTDPPDGVRMTPDDVTYAVKLDAGERLPADLGVQRLLCRRATSHPDPDPLAARWSRTSRPSDG